MAAKPIPEAPDGALGSKRREHDVHDVLRLLSARDVVALYNLDDRSSQNNRKYNTKTCALLATIATASMLRRRNILFDRFCLNTVIYEILEPGATMKIFEWIRALRSQLHDRNRASSRNRDKARMLESGTFVDEETFGGRDFDEKFSAAFKIIKVSLDRKFPDQYEARQYAGYDPKFDYVSSRCGAIDTSSSAIASALRKGASVTQAATAAARSIEL